MTETLELVVQPWTEDPAARANATGAGKKFFDSVDRIEELAGEITSRIDPGVKDVRRGLRSAAKAQLSNKEAVDQLKKWGKTYGAEYLSVGRPTRLSEEVLPGVKVTVLGPPTIDQEPDIQSYADEDANYWIGRPNTLPFGGATPAGLPPADPDLAKRLLESPAQVRWLIDRIDRQAAWNVRRIVRRMDDFLNNTSLILMFETGDRRLLFPGDAQIENWEYALTKAANSEDVRKKLASVDLYKVGHHGSRNATPKRLLYEPWRKKLNGHRMTSVVSTKEGKHGSTEETAVPRATLLEGLCHLGDVWGTHELKKAPFLEVWAPTEGAAGFQRAEA
jgi:hypothetical protein